MGDRSKHWEKVYETMDPAEVSWFEAEPRVSLDLIQASGMPKSGAIIDIGAGASRLSGALVEQGYSDVSALDLSEPALGAAAREMPKGTTVNWIVADARLWTPGREYDLWHDRAAFHFLTDPVDQEAYLDTLDRALRPGGHVIIGTFAVGGPEKCSGLPVQQYDADSLATRLGSAYRLIRSVIWDHETPFASLQRFHAGLFRKL